MEHVPEHDAVRLVLAGLPRDPADESVDRVRMRRLRERQLMPTALELVAAVLDAVRPWDEHLATPTSRHLVDAVAVDDVHPIDGVRPQTAADLDRDRPLVAERDLELLAGRRLSSLTLAARGQRSRPDGAPATTKDHSPMTSGDDAASA